MNIIVSKFGGSSVADADGFRRVLDIVARRRQPQYIILSAPGKRNPEDRKITDLLCEAHLGDRLSLERATERYAHIIDELNLPCSPLLSSLEKDVRFSRDHAVSRGEYLCARLFAEYASLPFADAADLIYFDESGDIDTAQTRASIRSMAKRLSCAVIPGFYGSMPDGSLRTFSRGGSDITGALIAAALNADCYENWTDVDGLMSADPAICPEAIVQPCVSYRQMQQISESGAQVLHPYCLEPVRRTGVPTLLKNTFAPGEPGTYISDRVEKNVPCVCSQDGFCAVRLNDLGKEARLLSAGLHADIYHDGNGASLLALRSEKSSIGSPAGIVSVFGLSRHQRADALRCPGCLGTMLLPECVRLLIRPESVRETVLRMHRLLDPQGFRNSPSA